MRRNILVVDQADSPGGSVERIIEIMNSLDSYNFFFVTLTRLDMLTTQNLNDHVISIHLISLHRIGKISEKLNRFQTGITAFKKVAHLLALIIGVADRFSMAFQLKYHLGRNVISLVQSNSDLFKFPFDFAR